MELTNKNINTLKKKKGNDMSSLVYGKIAPQAPELEAAVLGAIMLEPQALADVIEVCQTPDCFYSDANQRIYAAIRRMFDKGTRIDFMTVCEELRKSSELELVGGSFYVTNLTRDVVSSANIIEHARIVVEKYIMRELIRMSGSVISDAYEDGTDVFDLLDKAESNLYEITDKHLRRNFSSISSIIAKTLEEIEEQTKRTSDLTGVPSGFTELDKMTAGWQKTDLIILAARPAVGKTAFSLNLALNAALHPEPVPVAVFSLEMSVGQIVKRMLSAVTDVPLGKIAKGNLTDTDMRILHERRKKLTAAPIFLDDQAALNIFELRAKARRLKQKHDIGMIIIDYLQLMSGGDGGNTNREQEISKISRDLKQLAKELEIPIIALSQLNRNVENRKSENRTPQLSDLRESGAIEQDADMVMFMYRPEYYQQQGAGAAEGMPEAPNGLTEVSIAKHRNGKTGVVKIKAELEYQRFEDWQEGGFSIDRESFPKPNAGLSDRHLGGGSSLEIDEQYTKLGSKANNMTFDDDDKPEEDEEDHPF